MLPILSRSPSVLCHIEQARTKLPRITNAFQAVGQACWNSKNKNRSGVTTRADVRWRLVLSLLACGCPLVVSSSRNHDERLSLSSPQRTGHLQQLLLYVFTQNQKRSTQCAAAASVPQLNSPQTNNTTHTTHAIESDSGVAPTSKTVAAADLVYDVFNQWADAGQRGRDSAKCQAVLVPFSGKDVDLMLWLRARGFRVVGVAEQASKIDAAVRQCNNDVDSVTFQRSVQCGQSSRNKLEGRGDDIVSRNIIIHYEIDTTITPTPTSPYLHRRNLPPPGSITLLNGQFSNLGLVGASFDFSFDRLSAFELRDTDERKRYVKTVAHLLKPGGRLLLFEPTDPGLAATAGEASATPLVPTSNVRNTNVSSSAHVSIHGLFHKRGFIVERLSHDSCQDVYVIQKRLFTR